ncbi:MAG: hypothetical protein J0H50_13620, partial [Xanthomonadales bacterium]|nr:hypothetical protein [Xanthomonadales bacterium]
MAHESFDMAAGGAGAPSAGVDMGGYTLFDDASLAARNTLRVAARAARLVELRDVASLPAVLEYGLLPDHPLLALGEGSNILFAGDYPGNVLVMATRG